MEEGLVSIIIPTYNRAHLIGETLDSILQQSYKIWECIVVDDGSDDYTSELLDFYVQKDSRIKYHKRPKEKTKGANACRNYGYEKSNGEFINWFDSDDLMLPDKLNFQIKKLDRDYDLSICQTFVFENFSNQKCFTKFEGIWSESPLEDFIAARIAWTTSIPIWRRSFISRINENFDEDLQAAQEWEFFCRCLFSKPNVIFNQVELVRVRKHQDSISYGNEDKKLIHYYLAREKLYNFLKKNEYYSQFLANYFINSFQKRIMAGYYKKGLDVLRNQLIFNKAIKLKYRIKLVIAYFSYLFIGRGEILFKGREFI